MKTNLEFIFLLEKKIRRLVQLEFFFKYIKSRVKSKFSSKKKKKTHSNIGW